MSPDRYRLLLTLNGKQKAKLELARDLLSHANAEGDLAVVIERALDELILRLEKRRFGRTNQRGRVVNARPAASEATEAAVLMPRAATSEATEAAVPLSRPVASEATEAAVPLSRLVASKATEAALSWPAASAATGAAVPLPRPATPGTHRQHIRHAVRRELVGRDGVCCSFVSSDGQRCEARAFLQLHHRQPWACGGADTADNLSLLCRAHNRLLAEQDFGRSRVEQAIVKARLSADEGVGPAVATLAGQGAKVS